MKEQHEKSGVTWNANKKVARNLNQNCHLETHPEVFLQF